DLQGPEAPPVERYLFLEETEDAVGHRRVRYGERRVDRAPALRRRSGEVGAQPPAANPDRDANRHRLIRLPVAVQGAFEADLPARRPVEQGLYAAGSPLLRLGHPAADLREAIAPQ